MKKLIVLTLLILNSMYCSDLMPDFSDECSYSFNHFIKKIKFIKRGHYFYLYNESDLPIGSHIILKLNGIYFNIGKDGKIINLKTKEIVNFLNNYNK